MTIVIPTWVLWLIGVPTGLFLLGAAIVGLFFILFFEAWPR